MNLDAAMMAQRARAGWAEYFRRATVHEILMGAQDNLTNVLAVVLGVTIGSGRADFVALAGLSAGIAESISMGGVLYNATRAELRLEAASGTVRTGGAARLAPFASGVVTFAAGMVAGVIPLLPFLFLPVSSAIYATFALSIFGLFLLGSYTGRLSGDAWLGEGIRLVLIGGLAALSAAILGALLHVD
jgi:VIT1/CCC1 family predicted Fe2+/Mn2+ transporter